MQSSSYYRACARDILRGRWGKAVLVTFIAALLGLEKQYSSLKFHFSLGNGNVTYSGLYPYTFLGEIPGFADIVLIISVVIFLIGGAIQLGYCKYQLRFCNGETPSISSLFDYLPYFGKALLLRILTTLFILLWSLLFIIPGIVAAFSYQMAPYILAENPDMGVLDAITESKNLMYGNRFQLFCLDLSFIGWAFLTAFTFGIGNLLLIPYMETSFTVFYLTLTGASNRS